MVNFETQSAIDQFNARYAAALDALPESPAFDSWPGFFTDDCLYKVTARENFDRGLPLALMAYESRGMLEDRLYGVRRTLFHAPYYQRHVVGVALVESEDAEGIRAAASFAVFRTRPGQSSEVYFVGRYHDLFVRSSAGLRLRERICVYDNEMVLNSLIYPI